MLRAQNKDTELVEMPFDDDQGIEPVEVPSAKGIIFRLLRQMAAHYVKWPFVT